MVFGVGTDIVQVSRVESIWQRFGERFADRLLLDDERELFAFRYQGSRREGNGYRVRSWHVGPGCWHDAERPGTAADHLFRSRSPNVQATRYRRQPCVRHGRSRSGSCGSGAHELEWREKLT